jgi:hypothetical protein
VAAYREVSTADGVDALQMAGSRRALLRESAEAPAGGEPPAQPRAVDGANGSERPRSVVADDSEGQAAGGADAAQRRGQTREERSIAEDARLQRGRVEEPGKQNPDGKRAAQSPGEVVHWFLRLLLLCEPRVVMESKALFKILSDEFSATGDEGEESSRFYEPLAEPDVLHRQHTLDALDQQAGVRYARADGRHHPRVGALRCVARQEWRSAIDYFIADSCDDFQKGR